VIKIRLSDFSKVGVLTLAKGQSYFQTAVFDFAQGHGFFGTFTTHGKVYRINLTDLTLLETLSLGFLEDRLVSSVIDPQGKYAYFGTETDPGKVIRVPLQWWKVFLPTVMK
jgi:hypothetical protein